jgi:radical SAM superfamily enzyme YgiQ (UPF0313 family)
VSLGASKTLVFYNPTYHFYELHGIYAISAVLKQHGYNVSYLREPNFKKAIRIFKQMRPDVLLYSTTSPYMPLFFRFDRLLKKEVRTFSVIGGTGPTYDPQAIKETTIDAQCIGEGEYALVDFLQNGLRSGKNISLKNDPLPHDFHPLVNLDELPFPDRDCVYDRDSLLRTSSSKYFISGRGCPYQCTYCFNHRFNEMFRNKGPVIRKKSVGYLFEEIEGVRKKHPFHNVVFVDDTFIIDKKWFLEFASRFRSEVKVDYYTCNIRANLIDEDIVKGLKESGCLAVNWSIESGNDFIRNQVLKRNIKKEQILTTAELLHRYKIRFRIGNLLGLPGESFAQMVETLKYNMTAKPFLGFASIFVPFPRLELTEYAIRNGHYTPRPNEEFPKDYSRSILNFPEAEKIKIAKLRALFPLFVDFPFFFKNRPAKKILFRFPLFILTIFYEIYWAIKMMFIYLQDISFLQMLRMSGRHIGDLIERGTKSK